MESYKKGFDILSKIFRLIGSSNLGFDYFQVGSKSTHDWLMDERVSNVDDIFILFIKMEIESCSRLGSKQQLKPFWGPFFRV